MMFSLKNHPFAVETTFETSVVLTFAVDKNELKDLIPSCLQLDVFDNQWGFVALALVSSKKLRPKGFPEFLGDDFILAGYRIFVKYVNPQGKIYRGLYILKSETNKPKMSFFGNIFTHYNYTTTDISFQKENDIFRIISEKSGIDISIKNQETAALPPSSPFSDWKQARKFAGPLPFTFTCNEKKGQILIIEGVRQNWVPKPLEIAAYVIDYFTTLNFGKMLLANAFVIENIPYYWKKGKIEKWKQ